MNKMHQPANGLPADPMESIRSHVDALAEAADLWATRDDTKAQPEVTRAGHAAVDSIDGLVRDLYAMRNRLIDEIRQSQRAADVRIDALLAKSRATVTRVDALLARHSARA